MVEQTFKRRASGIELDCIIKYCVQFQFKEHLGKLQKPNQLPQSDPHLTAHPGSESQCNQINIHLGKLYTSSHPSSKAFHHWSAIAAHFMGNLNGLQAKTSFSIIYWCTPIYKNDLSEHTTFEPLPHWWGIIIYCISLHSSVSFF